MIVDTLTNASIYSKLHPLFAKAFAYVNDKDILTLEDGTYEITDGLKLIVATGEAKLKEESLKKFECHDLYIDIQICARGLETIAWKPREKCSVKNGDYDPVRDRRFFHDEPDMFFQLTDNQFAIFYPNDVHAPMIGDGEVKKLVFKVKI
ncbi:YhcH/YjgK/YiaL family protein [Psychroserpens damuponensis]|uniref:YhcH/YjgK/YiaL family protein n=1 Tax=Psychroserpens damuponensis TaxID=943936 RepID=UPI00058D7A46|nr:YhcH/YjgK/YiaL family protein [Psychroserpens damuponensis]